MANLRHHVRQILKKATLWDGCCDPAKPLLPLIRLISCRSTHWPHGFVMHGGHPLMTVTTLMGGDMQAQDIRRRWSYLRISAPTFSIRRHAIFRIRRLSTTLSLETPLYDLGGRKADGDCPRLLPSAARICASFSHHFRGSRDRASEEAGPPKPLHGGYFGRSDFRKDGEAVGVTMPTSVNFYNPTAQRIRPPVN